MQQYSVLIYKTMDINEIEKKLAEYQAKLESTKLVETRKGIKRRSAIPGHLRNYILTEVKKLERLKENLQKQPEVIATLSWDQIRFKDGEIVFKLPNNKITNSFPLNISRRSFEYLKPYFNKFDLPNFSVVLQGARIISITNIWEISSVLNFLTAQEELKNKY